MSTSSTLRSISWLELFPWLIIFRSFSISLGLTAMLAALVGALLMPLGWKLSEALFIGPEPSTMGYDTPGERSNISNLVRRLGDINPRDGAFDSIAGQAGVLPHSRLQGQMGDWSVTFNRFASPVRALFSLQITLREFAYLVCGFLWSLAVWAFCGGIIVRQAVVKLSVDERISLRSTVGHTCSKYLAYLTAPLFPLLVIVLLTIPIALVGLLMRGGDVGAFIAALLWIFVLMAGVAMAITLLGLLFGWPLMWGAIAAEKHSDSFDAVSRAYSYVFQRPLHYLFYAIVASLFGALCWILAEYLEAAVIGLSWWSASFGAGVERVAVLRGAIEHREGVAGFGHTVVTTFVLWEGLVHLIATAFRYSFFWTATAAIYLLLRYDADRTELDEMFLEEEENLRKLPTLSTDDRGVPEPPAEPSE